MRARGLTAPLSREGGPSYRDAKGGECYRSKVQPSQRNHRTQAQSPFMPWGLKRYQQTRQLHFATFSCCHRKPLLANSQACDIFVQTLEWQLCHRGRHLAHRQRQHHARNTADDHAHADQDA